MAVANRLGVVNRSSVPDDHVALALSSLESWVIRRTLTRDTMKDVNKMMVAILVLLDAGTVAEAGEVVRDFLAGQTSDARTWPTDEAVLAALPTVRLYGNVRQSRLRVVLEGIEQVIRTERHETNVVPLKLEIEQVMPPGWTSHWDPEIQADPVASAKREQWINTLGNLTLVTQKLNGVLLHRPWTNAQALIVAPTGKDAGLGKRSLINRYSTLVLNKEIVDDHMEQWSDTDISARGLELSKRACLAWPRFSSAD